MLLTYAFTEARTYRKTPLALSSTFQIALHLCFLNSVYTAVHNVIHVVVAVAALCVCADG